jgi:hypothetical protein
VAVSPDNCDSGTAHCTPFAVDGRRTSTGRPLVIQISAGYPYIPTQTLPLGTVTAAGQPTGGGKAAITGDSS